MPLPIPNLDDRTFSDLVEEGRALIPAYAPEWTNHNPSDPGITLLEMFAYLSEMLMYRLNRVTDDNMLAFLKLLNGPKWTPPALTPGNRAAVLAEERRKAVAALRQPNRAVTCDDFERLALAAAPLPSGERAARAHCIARRNMASAVAAAHGQEQPGHVSVVIVPQAGPAADAPQPSPELVQTVAAHLEPRRLLTTQVHVVGPRYVAVGVRVTLGLKRDAVEASVRSRAAEALRRFLHPLTGGTDGQGWPFGRPVYVSEIYQLLDTLPGVDYVTQTANPVTGKGQDELVLPDTDGAQGRLVRLHPGDPASPLVAADIRPGELVDARLEDMHLTLISPAA